VNMNGWTAKALVTAVLLAASGCANKSEDAARAVVIPVAVPVPVPTSAAVVAAATTASAPVVTPAVAKSDAKPSDAKAAKPVDINAKLAVRRLVVAEGVKDREPVDAKSSFEKGEAKKLYAFIEIENIDKKASEVEVSFVPPNGSDTGAISLSVGESSRWRTWAFTRNANQVGTWTAVVKNKRGEVLARTPFEITS